MSASSAEKIGFAQIAAMAGGHAEARAIQAALKLGLFEALANGALEENALAAALRCDPRATGILASALTALGLLTKHRDGKFALTDASRRYLLRASIEYLGGMILFDGALWDVWGRLEDSIRSGEPARTPDMFQSSDDDAMLFIGAMDSLVRARGDAVWVAENLDLSPVSSVADLGGGPGTYVAAMLKRWPHLHAAIWDLPATLRVARTILEQREPGVHRRIAMVEADYHGRELPAAVDVIFMSNIIHSETAETNAELMRKCFDAIKPGGMLIVKDHIMNEALTEPVAGAVFSMFMLLTTRGRDYSRDELSSWMRAAGFHDLEERALPSPPFSSSMVIAYR